MGIATDIALWRAKLDIAIDGAMQGKVTDAAKEAILTAALRDVYIYPPEFYSRRYGDGGLVDEDNINTTYFSATKTLEVTDNAPWQQLYGGPVPEKRLAEAIEDGTNMYGAGARPFFDDADKELGERRGKAERALVEELREAGFTVI